MKIIDKEAEEVDSSSLDTREKTKRNKSYGDLSSLKFQLKRKPDKRKPVRLKFMRMKNKMPIIMSR
jgi:hypothetical protein